MALLSVVIPSRNERYLDATVRDVLTKAVGDVEVIPILDGLQPGVPVPDWDDSAVQPIYHEHALGMRPSINEAVARSSGDFVMKCDAHCLFAEGFDQVVTSEIEPNWVVTLRRYSLAPETWSVIPNEEPRDAHYLSFPFADPRKEPYMRGLTWKQRARERKHILLDDEMSSQGSCWVMSREHWDQRIGPLDSTYYGPFQQEFQEVGMKTWLGGGAVKIQKRTHYAHWYKRQGQGYVLSPRQSHAGIRYSYDTWFHDRWQGRVRDLAWLIDKFWPVPGWPDDWRAVQRATDTLAEVSA